MSNRFIPDRETGPAAGAMGTDSPDKFEFSSSDNDGFRKLSTVMKFVGVMMSVFGVLNVVTVMHVHMNLDSVLTIGQGVVMVLIGGWLSSAARSFRAIAETEGNDVGYLRVAISKLRSVYTLQAWLMGLACVLVTVGIVAALKH
jgi:hypothetical protein